MADLKVPMKRLLAPQTAPILYTVPGRVLTIDIGALSVAGEGGLTHLVPVIEKFDIGTEKDVPIDDIGSYFTQALLPNTVWKIGKHITKGLFSLGKYAVTGKWADANEGGFAHDVIDPFFESFTKYPILGGAGMTVEQLEDYTGLNRSRFGTKPTGSSYPSIKIDNLGREHGTQYGRAIGLTEGREGSRTGSKKMAQKYIWRHFGEDCNAVISNGDFMDGVYEGIDEAAPYKGRKAKVSHTGMADSRLKKSRMADGYPYSLAANF